MVSVTNRTAKKKQIKCRSFHKIVVSLPPISMPNGVMAAQLTLDQLV